MMGCGFRPIVILKSDTTIKKQLNGTFKIYDDNTAPTITIDELDASTITAEDYGGYVTNYASSDSDAQQSVGWRIFHSDGENIYLIADDYIETQYIPAGKGNTAITTNTTDDYAQGFGFTSLVNDYTGWVDISSSTIATKWLSQYAASTYTSANKNMKATAYLLDTSVWNPVFANSNYAEYAIGGPTLELFTASYNVTHTDKTIDTQVSSATGYQVKWSTDTSYADSIHGLNKSEDLYVISDNTNAYAMWVASPSARLAGTISSVDSYGQVNYCDYSLSTRGARVLVALKSDVKLVKLEGGTYLINPTQEEIEANKKWTKTKELEVKIVDRKSGLTEGATVQYGWSRSSSAEPTNWKDATIEGYTVGAKSTTFTAQATEQDALSGEYYLWVKAITVADTIGNAIEENTTIVSINTYSLDNAAPTITIDELDASTITAEDYGGYVTNYASSDSAAQQSVGWRIFHSDGENIYLIADDYVKNTYVPNGKGGTAANKTGTYTVSLSDIAEGQDYAGTGDIASTLKTKLLSKFGENTNTTYNGKTTAYLMDTEVWNPVFANSHAEYAVGGPTLELFVASYNATHETDIDTQVLDRYGYQLKRSTDSEYTDWVDIYYSTIDNESLYFINNFEKGSTYWVASPSAIAVNCVFGAVTRVVNEFGSVGYLGYENTHIGARPIVALKSDTKLVKQENGTYLINPTEEELISNKTWTKTKEVEVKIVDQQSGLAEGTAVKYGWSTSEAEEPTSWQELTLSGYASGTNSVTFTAVATEADALSGKYYLWVKPVTLKDTVETEPNVQTETKKSESIYWIDSIAPTIELESQGSTGWTSNLSVEINVKEEHSGLSSGASLQYGWSSSNLEEPTVWKTANLPEYTAGTTEGITFTATSEGVAGKYYLWVKPASLSDTTADGGNIQAAVTISTGTFNLDNIAPEIIIDTFTASTISPDNYGKYVTNYASSDSAAQQSVGWRIFHSDGENIYLIADDYIENQYAPNGKGNTALNKNGKYEVYFTDLVTNGDYVGSSDIESDIKAKWLSKYTYTSTNANMQVIAYLMDTGVWDTVFANNNYAEYAIGGPTLELFVASYNATHKKHIEIQADEIGYDVKWSDGEYGNYEIEGLDTTGSLYMINHSTNAAAMWLASPSGSGDEHVRLASWDGLVTYFIYIHELVGLRPVIALKSDTKLQKQSDGSFTILGETEKLTASTITTEDYGGYVTNYAASDSAAQQSVGWRIFHSDGENIYLIADNYIENQYKPAGKGGINYNNTSGTYGADLNSIYDYAGSADISSDLKAKWLIQYIYTNTDYNAKATAYLLDTSVWNTDFANSYADYAIGGPTLELLTASYNAIHNTDIDTQALEDADKGATGYKVKWSTDTAYSYYLEGLDTTEDLYVISDTYDDTVYGMWLASPSAAGNMGMCLLDYYGQIRYDGCGSGLEGLRPIVALKSNIQLEKKSDGTYIIEDTWSKTKEVEVEIVDNQSGLAAGAKVQYGWSTSNETQPTEWKDLTLTGYTAGANSVKFMAQATEEDALTGKYYLWVKPVDVKDMALETANAIATDDINNWKKSETQYLLDNTAPTITLGVEGNSTWMNNVLVGVKIKDEHSGLNTGASLQYGWSLSNTEEPTEWETINTTDYSAGTTQEITFTASSTGLSGKYYLWVKPTNLSDMSAEDGNIPETKISTGTFYLDNTAPTIVILDDGTTEEDTTWHKSVNVTVEMKDEHSGLNTDSNIQYGWSTSQTEGPQSWISAGVSTYEAGANTTSFEATAAGLTGEYYLWVKAITLGDIVGNYLEENETTALANKYYLDNTAPEIIIDTFTASTITADDYGGYVTNYASSDSEAQQSVGWRIFHSDGENIYLIADDYIANTYVPAGKGGTYCNSSIYTTYVTSLDALNDYVGSADISSDLKNKWLSKYTYESTNMNMQATAYLMDTEVWNTGFANSYAEYAIGGPTLELFVASYNKMHPEKTIETAVLDAIGYQVKWSTDANYANSISDLGEIEDLYAKSKTYSYIDEIMEDEREGVIEYTWLASPAAGGPANIMNLSSELWYLVPIIPTDSLSYGVRPIISLKSTVHLEKKSDGTYVIVENSEDTWSKTKDIEVKIEDKHSGLAEGAKLQYGWSTSAGTEPTSWKDVTLSGYAAGDKSASFTAQATEEDALTGKYYLWVKPVEIKDIVEEDANEQNTTEISESQYLLDNTAPTITLGAQGSESWLKELSVGVQIRDEHSGLNTGASLQYAWSLSNTETPTQWTTITPAEYTAGTTGNVTLTAESGALTGKYYLWIKPVNVVDTSIEGGNTQGTTIVSTGTFNLDNTVPIISVQNDAEETEKVWYKSGSVQVEIKDEHSGLDLGPEVQYGWSTSSATGPEVWTTINPAGYTAGTQSATFIVATAGLTGEYYLWLKPISLADVAGNYITESEATTSTKKFYLDNTAPEIAIDTFTASTITADNYGGYVTNYASSDSAAQQSVGWRIFHSDGENIYLIADDYIENKYAPAGKGGTAGNTNGTHKLYFSDIITNADYAGSADISSELKNKWLNQYSSYTSTDTNAKVTAYLLDTSVWNTGFANNYAEYAIGGPTLELFTASYNATHETHIEIKANETGYDVKWPDGEYGKDYYITGLDRAETLYVIQDNTNAKGMWSASPSARTNISIINIHYGGNVQRSDYNNTGYGLRPIVALKSDVKLAKQEDGTYLVNPTEEELNSSNHTWSQTKEVEVKIVDNHSGLAEGATLQYGWSTSTETEPTTWKEIQVTGYTAGANSATFIAEATKEDALTGKYHLWVRPVNLKDISIENGNSVEQDYLEKSEGTYWLDNTAPTIGSISAIGSSESTFDLEISGIADNVGVAEQSGPKGYYVSTSNQAPTANSEWILSGERAVTYEGAQETTTYYIWEIDNANNISEAKTFTTNVINYAVENSSWYEIFAEAVAGATSGNTIKVVKNVTDTTSGTIDKNIILNLNAKTLTLDQNSIKVNSGVTLEVNGNGKLETTSISSPVIETAGTLTLKQVTMNGNSTAVVKSSNSGNINIDGASLNGNIYTGSGTTNVNSGTINGDIYGGDYQAAITGNTTININGGTIDGSIYGGPRDNVLNGNATINIGKSATGNAGTEATTLEITGNIYGGGNKPEEKGYSVQTLTGTSTIKIDGTGYTTFNLSGSIFGAGKQSTVGVANIAIQNLGTATTPHIIESIQRANTLTIDNSNVEIIGIADNSNASPETQFTLNRIGNLKIKNGTTMHLRRGFNKVEELNSLVDVNGTETKAVVAIENGLIASSNVTNRIYVYQGINLIIAKEEYKQNEQPSNYGSVNGMTFFGMYTHDRKTDALKYDIYHPTAPTNGNLFALGSYVEGVYNSNENAKTTDGFYTNKVDENTSSIVADYIEITPYEQIYQDWILGLKTYTQEVTMTANRDQNKVYQSIPFDYFTQAGSSYNITLFSVNSLEKDINLIDKTQIPTVAATSAEANTNFALTMNNAQEGWKTKGETSFYTSETTPIKGTTQYITDDTGKIPYFDLYLHNSLNITKTSDCGLVNIVFMVKQTTNATSGQTRTFKVAITVNLRTEAESDLAEFTTESQIIKGKNYGLFSESEVHISGRSQMTLYTNIYPLGTYAESDYRVLTSTCELPLNTEITMIDYAQGSQPVIYHYIVKDGYDALGSGTYMYNLSNFKLMGTTSDTAKYANPNSAYAAQRYEEYRFIFDFKNATIDNDLLKQTIKLEIRDGENSTLKNREETKATFNIYKTQNSALILQLTENEENITQIIEQGKLTFNIVSDITKQESGATTIHDTYYDDKKLGMSISIYDSANNKVSYEKLAGTYFVIDGQEYYPGLAGITRICLSDNIVKVSKNIEANIDAKLLTTGDYTIKVETFASANGTHYGLNGDKQEDIAMSTLDINNGLQVEITDADKVIDASTGKTSEGDNIIKADIKASNIAEDTNIRMKLYKRNDTFNTDLTYADVSYTHVDLQDYVSTNLTKVENSVSDYEYLVTDEVGSETTISLELALNQNLPTGGYKLVFEVYSGDTCIGTVERHLVAADLAN